MKKILFLSLFVFIFLFFSPNNSFAYECHASTCACTARCITGCEGETQTRSCELVCADGICRCVCTPWVIANDCQSWQQCNGGMSCYCHGPCIDSPQDPRLFNNPNFPTDPNSPEESIPLEDVLLPVKFDWANVRGWKINPEGVNSYIIEIDNTTRNTFNTYLPSSEFTPPPCLLRSITKHEWRVRGCCSENGQNCGPWSEQQFKTNVAPEIRSIFGDSRGVIHNYILQHNKLPDQTHPIFNYLNPDPDWAGPGIKTSRNLMPPIVIDWCPINSPEKERLRTELKRVLISEHRFSPDHKFPTGFSTRYMIYFQEYREGWRSHFRNTPAVRYRWVSFEQNPQTTIYPDFFLDQNRFFLTHNTRYQTTVKRCAVLYRRGEEESDGEGFHCFDPSQEWRFKTMGDATNLPQVEDVLIPIQYENKDETIQPLPFYTRFRIAPGANYYQFFAVGAAEGSPGITRGFIKDSRIFVFPNPGFFRKHSPDIPSPILEGDLVFTYPGGVGDKILQLNQEYRFFIWSCLTNEVNQFGIGTNCDENFRLVQFRTPGSPPTNLRITSARQNGKKVIPVIFDWDDMRGINSYKVRITGREEPFISQLSNITIEYPDLVLNQTYNIRVWSCVDRYGKVCGTIYNHLNFNTFLLKPPTGLEVYPEGAEVYPPVEKGQVKTEYFVDFEWGAVVGAAYYQIEIKDSVGATITRNINTNSFRIHQRYLVELGDYTWRVRACIDKDCKRIGETTSNWSIEANFHLLPAIGAPNEWFGLVVCGRLTDNPATRNWNEREACTIRHIPLTAYVVINFILWTVVPLILILLVILTAFFYYTAFANAEEANQITPKVKKMWKNFAIGFFLLFFGFTIVNIFLGIIGFNIDLFGRWYEIY